MEVINYNDLYKRTNAAIEDRNIRAKEMGYNDFNDYLDSQPTELSYADRNWKFSRDYYNFIKDELGTEDLINQTAETALIFDGKNSIDEIMQNKDICNIKEIVKIVKTAYKSESELDDDENVKHLEQGKKIVKEMFNKGVNKEQVKVMLLKEEKAWTKKLIEEAKKQKNRDENLISKGKKILRKIYATKRDLNNIKTPYDKFFEMSAEVSKSKKLKTKYENSLNPIDAKYADIELQNIINLQEKISQGLENVDPRIVQDVVKDKIETQKLEMEIDYIKMGAELIPETETSIENTINELKINFKPLMKIVKSQIESIQQKSSSYNI